MTTWSAVLGDADYPRALAGVSNPPERLYLRGRAEAMAAPCVAVVGTRRASRAGLLAAFAVGEALAGMGVCVVSGLALGVDGEAHRGAMAAGGLTVAVLAHGLDRVYPDDHRGLAGEVLATGGALVSEHPDGTPPEKRFFVQRNRIIAGLCRALVLVESDERGGAMHAVRFAHEAGRPVFCVWSREPMAQLAGGEAACREYRASWVKSTGGLKAAVGRAVGRG